MATCEKSKGRNGSKELESDDVVGDKEEESTRMMLRYKYADEQWSPLNPEGKKNYDREFLMQFQNDYNAVQKPAGLPDIPDIILDKPFFQPNQQNMNVRPQRYPNPANPQSMIYGPQMIYAMGNTQFPGQQQIIMNTSMIPQQRMPSPQYNPSGMPSNQPGFIHQIPPQQTPISYPQGYGNQPLFMGSQATSQRPPSTQGQGPPQYAKPKEKKHILSIVDPNSGKDVTAEILKTTQSSEVTGSSDSGSRSTPVGSTEPQKMERQFSRDAGQQEFIDFTPKYVWSGGGGGGGQKKLYKEVQSILDKLTPQTFQTLVSKMQKLLIHTEREMIGVVDLVYEKAVSETRSSIVYANMCRCLPMYKVPSETKPEEMVSFRAVLLKRCRREFEKDKSSEAMFITKREEIEKADDGAKKEELKQELKNDVSKAKQRRVGNLRFTGELFKLKMLSENIMHDYVFKLLRTKDPENLECVCTLLTTIGKELDVDKAKPRMDQYFQHMGKLVNEKKTPSAVRIMLQDVMDLRMNRWVPPLDQIQKWQEEQKKVLLSQQRGGCRRKVQSWMSGVDGWGTQNVDKSAMQQCPDGGAGRFSGWGRDSTSGTTGKHTEKKKLSTIRAIGVSQSVDGGHRERRRCRTEPEPQPSHIQPASTELKILSKEDMENKTRDILDEFFAVKDMKEAILCVQELSTQNQHHFVYNAITYVIERSSHARKHTGYILHELERSSQERKHTGHILHHLVKQSVISVDNYIKGLVKVLEFAEDLDIPKIWQYYGELISPMIQDESVPLSFLKQAAAPLIAKNNVGVLLAEILYDVSHREGHEKVADLWERSGLQWSEFMPQNQVEQFLIYRGLEYTNGGDSAPTTPTTGLPLTEIEVKLHELIVKSKADNETVFYWIENNVDDPTTKRAKFIRALTTAVCNSAIKGEKGKERLEPKKIGARNDLLQKYLDHQADSELQVLYAVQALTTKLEHPKGVLRLMFDTLYDEDIISEDVFFQWEKSEEEPEGKVVCLKQAIQFFTWLREAAEDSGK